MLKVIEGTTEDQSRKFYRRAAEFVMLSTEDKKSKVHDYIDPRIVGNAAWASELGFCQRSQAIKFLRHFAQRAKNEGVGLTGFFFEDLCRKHGI